MIEENEKRKLTIIIVAMIAILILIIFIFLYLKISRSSAKVQEEKIIEKENVNKPKEEKTKEKKKKSPPPSKEDNTPTSKKESKPSQSSDSASGKSGGADVMNDLKNKKMGGSESRSKKEELIWEKAVYQTKKMIKKRQSAIFPDLNTLGTSISIISENAYLVSGFFILEKTKKYYFKCIIYETKKKQMIADLPKIQDHKF